MPKNSDTSIVHDSNGTDDFFNNRDLFTTYIEYEHQFKIKTGKKIPDYGYSNINSRISNHQDRTNTLTVINVSLVLELDYNLLNIISLTRKGIEIFLRKANHSSEIIVNEKIFRLVNIIKNQYVIELAEISKPTIVNQVITLTIQTWFT